MKHIGRLIGAGAVGWLLTLPLQAQSRLAMPLPLSATARIQRTVDSLQRLTQPGYLATRVVARQKADRQTANARQVNTATGCPVTYLCRQTTGPIVSVKNGWWDDPTTWASLTVPTSASSVVVQHRVQLPVNYIAQVKAVRLNAGGSVNPLTGSQLRLSQ